MIWSWVALAVVIVAVVVLAVVALGTMRHLAPMRTALKSLEDRKAQVARLQPALDDLKAQQEHLQQRVVLVQERVGLVQERVAAIKASREPDTE